MMALLDKNTTWYEITRTLRSIFLQMIFNRGATATWYADNGHTRQSVKW